MAAVTRKSSRTEAIARLMPALTALFVIGYAIVAYAFLYVPKLGRMVSGGDLDLAPYTQRLNETNAYGQQLQKLQDSYDAVNVDGRNRVEQMIPAGEDVQSLYAILDSLATQNGMVMTSISTVLDSKTMTDSGRQVVQVSFNVAGGPYPQMKSFIVALEHEQRIVDVTSIVFSASTSTYGISAKAYVFSPSRLTTPPPPPMPGAASPNQTSQ